MYETTSIGRIRQLIFRNTASVALDSEDCDGETLVIAPDFMTRLLPGLSLVSSRPLGRYRSGAVAWRTTLSRLRNSRPGRVAGGIPRPQSSGHVQNEWRMPRSAANWEPGTPKSAPLIARPVFMRP